MPRRRRFNPAIIEASFRTILVEGLGLDLTDPNLTDTPRRVAKMYCKELFSSIGKRFKDFKAFPNDKGYNQIILLDSVFFSSTCAHHFLPFLGRAWMAYIPDNKLIGASKPTRLIEHYAARPQLQEGLGHDVAEAFMRGVKPQGVMVLIRAEHECMRCRGVRQQTGAGMVTSVVKGVFKTDPSLEIKALQMIALSAEKRPGS